MNRPTVGQVAYMRQLMQDLAEENTFKITAFVRDVAFRPGEVPCSTFLSNVVNSGSQPSAGWALHVPSACRGPDRWIEAIGVLVEAAEDYARTVENNSHEGRVRSLLHFRVQELYRMNAVRHGADDDAMIAEFKWLMWRNADEMTMRSIIRNYPSGIFDAQLTGELWKMNKPLDATRVDSSIPN